MGNPHWVITMGNPMGIPHGDGEVVQVSRLLIWTNNCKGKHTACAADSTRANGTDTVCAVIAHTQTEHMLFTTENDCMDGMCSVCVGQPDQTACMHALHACIHACIHACVHVHAINACMHVCMYACMYA